MITITPGRLHAVRALPARKVVASAFTIVAGTVAALAVAGALVLTLTAVALP